MVVAAQMLLSNNIFLSFKLTEWKCFKLIIEVCKTKHNMGTALLHSVTAAGIVHSLKIIPIAVEVTE